MFDKEYKSVDAMKSLTQEFFSLKQHSMIVREYYTRFNTLIVYTLGVTNIV